MSLLATVAIFCFALIHSITGCAVQTGSLVVYTTPSPIVSSGVGGNCFGGIGPPHTSCLNNNPNFVGFGNVDPAVIVNLHNIARTSVSPRAKDMDLLSWNHIVAYLAQRWAAQCGNYSERVKYRSIPGIWDYVGQNVFVHMNSSSVNFNIAFNVWLNQKVTGPFSYGDMGLTYNRVGYYTQIIWADSQVVGCAAAVCNNPVAVHYVCNYAPGGNLAMDGRHPFAYPYTRSDTTG